jgi:hypothetical protein
MPLTNVPLQAAPRTLNVPLSASGVAPTKLGVEPFVPGDRVLALSAAAATLYGACSPRGDVTRSLKFIVAGADIAAAVNVVGQVAAAARVGTTKVTGDLTVSFGAAGGRLALGVIPACTTIAAPLEHLGAIVLVNGVVWGRIVDANAPNPAAASALGLAGQWGYDDNTDAGYTIVLGADTTGYIPVGAEVEILLPNLSLTGTSNMLLAKSAVAAGAALVAGVAEERYLGARLVTTDTAGRSSARLARVDFLAAGVGAAALVGIK